MTARTAGGGSGQCYRKLVPVWSLVFICLCVFLGIASRHLSEIIDDAFISFRYAKHLAEGAGLVFNLGERVEGYTNLLWVLVMAAGSKAGLALPPLSQTLSILCAASLILAVALFSKSYFRDLPFPYASYLAPVLLMLNPLFLEHIRTGLETLLFALLMFLSLALYFNQERKASLSYLTGIVLGLGYLTRPEAVIWACSFVAVDMSSTLIKGEKLSHGLARIVKYGGIFGVIVLLHIAWRVNYYGDWLPNTFYAKGGSNWSWGLKYTKDFLLSTGFLPLLVLCAGLVLLRRKWALCMSLIILISILYNIQVGGDFIFTGRFLFPLLPLIYLLLQELVRLTFMTPADASDIPRTKRLLAISRILMLVLFLLGAAREWSVARKRAEFTRSLNDTTMLLAECVRENTRPTDTIAVVSAGILSYYSERNTIDMLGLTDKHIARHGIVDKECFIGHQRADSDSVLDRLPRYILQVGGKASVYRKIAANGYMLRNPRLLELYELAQMDCGNFSYPVFERKSQPPG